MGKTNHSNVHERVADARRIEFSQNLDKMLSLICLQHEQCLIVFAGKLRLNLTDCCTSGSCACHEEEPSLLQTYIVVKPMLLL